MSTFLGPSLTLIVTYITVPVLRFKVEPRGYTAVTLVSVFIGLFILLWLSTGNSFNKSLGKAFVILMVSKPGERTYIQVI